MARVAAVIRDNPGVVLDMTISDLAATCRTSVATIVRFCRVLGLSGYAQLRMSLATELGREAAQFGGGMTLGAEIARSDSLQRSEEHTSELQSLMRISYAVFCLKKKTERYGTARFWRQS